MKNDLSSTRSFITITAVVAGLITASMTIAPAKAGGNQEIIPINANAYGNTYGEWSARWWQYMYSIPAKTNPILDTKGKFCDQSPPPPPPPPPLPPPPPSSLQQAGPVFFLAGTAGGDPVTRKCTVPAGKALFFPILNSVWGAAVGDCDPTVPGVACNLGILRKSAADSMDSVKLTAIIDGDPVENLTQQRVQSPVLTITYPDNSVTGVPEGTYAPNVSDGYWLLLPPLPAGSHTIYFKGVSTGGIFEGAVIEVTYKLFVQK